MELVVVVLVILVLMAIAIGSFRGTKRTNHFRAAQVAASSYAEGVEAYMADNGQRPPQLGNPEWPVTTLASRIGGPVDVMLRDSTGGPKRYLPRAAPEPVSDGLVELLRTGETASANAHAWITYSVAGDNYTFRVTARAQAGDPALECAVTNAASPPAGVQRCA